VPESKSFVRNSSLSVVVAVILSLVMVLLGGVDGIVAMTAFLLLNYGKVFKGKNSTAGFYGP